MTLKDLLKKKSSIDNTSSVPQGYSSNQPTESGLDVADFTFIRTTTTTEEHITLPTYPGDVQRLPQHQHSKRTSQTSKGAAQLTPEKKRHSLFRKTINNKQLGSEHDEKVAREDEKQKTAGEAIDDSPRAVGDKSELPVRPRTERKLSDRFKMVRMSRSSSRSSVNLPEGLDVEPDPIIVPVLSSPSSKTTEPGATPVPTVIPEDAQSKQTREAAWEKRATKLVLHKPLCDLSPSADKPPPNPLSSSNTHTRTPSQIAQDEQTLQTAIRLHESGDLSQSTTLFAQLADPSGANNALSQVLYGLALRHGWGTSPDPLSALHYLTLAAANSASIEAAALSTGLTNGGSAKGELVLAIFELANCYRYAWGVKKDAVAARTYYETAANLGDPDALEEAAWCCLEGYGGVKDKMRAAQYLRQAERMGKKSVGNSWIWKDKYNPAV